MMRHKRMNTIDYSMNNESYSQCMNAIVSEKGQVTIPQKIREQLGLKPGQVLEFEAREGMLIARKTGALHQVDQVVGILRGRIKNVDDYIDEIRGLRKK